VRGIEGVARTETIVVLSTHTERTRISLGADDGFPERPRRGRRRATELEENGGPRG
jgi:hypothetical protein